MITTRWDNGKLILDGPVAELMELKASIKKLDYSPDQPRAENGQFGPGSTVAREKMNAGASKGGFSLTSTETKTKTVIPGSKAAAETLKTRATARGWGAKISQPTQTGEHHVTISFQEKHTGAVGSFLRSQGHEAEEDKH